MRRMLIASTILLLMVLSPWTYATDNLEENSESNASGRAADIVISELFISPNNLVSNENSTNLYGAVDWLSLIHI